MQNSFFDWALADFYVFGLHFQYWMPAVLLIFAVFLLWELLGPRSGK
jgi:hypothetical protein